MAWPTRTQLLGLLIVLAGVVAYTLVRVSR